MKDPEPKIPNAIEMKRIWEETFDGLGIKTESILSKNVRVLPTLLAERMMNFFNEDARYYHHMYHIRNLFFQHWKFERFTRSIEPKERSLTSDRSKIIFFLCIWFHDLIYNPLASQKG